MALNPKTAVSVRNTALDAFDVLNSGKLRGYYGVQPADADTALGSQGVLFENDLSATAFAAGASGSKVANAIADDTSADGHADPVANPASFGSLLTSGNVRKQDYSIGTSGANLNLNSVQIVVGAKVSITSFTISQAA
jgi:hypothetical protein